MTAERDALAALVAAWDSKAYRKEWGPRMTAAIDAARVVLAAQPTVRYGCHCDIEAMDEGFEPDACVFDNGDIEDCIYATKLDKEGKGRDDCEYWRPIVMYAAPAQGEPQGTHWDGCATEGGPRHYDCAVAAIAALRAENDRFAKRNLTDMDRLYEMEQRAERAEERAQELEKQIAYKP